MWVGELRHRGGCPRELRVTSLPENDCRSYARNELQGVAPKGEELHSRHRHEHHGWASHYSSTQWKSTRRPHRANLDTLEGETYHDRAQGDAIDCFDVDMMYPSAR